MHAAAHLRVGQVQHFPARHVAIAAMPRISVETLARVRQNQLEKFPAFRGHTSQHSALLFRSDLCEALAEPGPAGPIDGRRGHRDRCAGTV